MTKITFVDGSVVEYLEANWVYHRGENICELRTACDGEAIAELDEFEIAENICNGVWMPVLATQRKVMK